MTDAPMFRQSQTPVFEQFVSRVTAKAQSLGISIVDKEGWVSFEAPNGHRTVVQKSVSKLPRVETTLDLPDTCSEVVELVRTNGRIRAALVPHPDVVMTALEIMAHPGTPAPVSKRGAGSKAPPSLDSLLGASPYKVPETVAQAPVLEAE